ncbi:hypothetical protein BH24ACI1_BH24ACI1_18510 [soil metagenome]
MNKTFSTNFRVRQSANELAAFFLIILCTVPPQTAFGQATVLTRTQFSRLTVTARARLFEPTISRIAAEEGVDPYLLWTIAYNETRFRPWLSSHAGAEGLMQFIPATAARFQLFDPFQPEPAIKAAARYVRFLSNRFGGRIDSILAGYNAGEGAVDAFLTGKTVRAGQKIINSRRIKTVGGVPPYRETVGYVARGLIVYRILRERQIFPGAFVTSVYPTAVSELVARVSLNDREIGINGSLLAMLSNRGFLNANPSVQPNFPLQSDFYATDTKKLMPQFVSRDAINLRSNMPVNSSENAEVRVSAAKSNPNGQKAVSSSQEVYYEPRTGARFGVSDNKIERLPETGELVVGDRLSAAAAHYTSACVTFFGGTSPK